MQSRSKRRQAQHLKPWIIDTILSHDKPIKAQSVKVLKHIDGPREDGTIIRVVTDGTVFIKSVFTAEALAEMFSEEGSTQPEWYSALLILKKFTVSFDVRNCLGNREFVLTVDSASIWDLQQGFYLKYKVTDCMDNQDVRTLALEKNKNFLMSQNRNDSMDCSIPLTQLMGNLSYEESQIGQSSKNTEDIAELTDQFEFKEFIIPEEQNDILNNIVEWQLNYAPSLEDNTQLSPSKSQEILQKEEVKNDLLTEKKIICADTDKTKLKEVIGSSSDIISSGESIKLSCSDYSEDDTDIQLHNNKAGSVVHISSSSDHDVRKSQEEIQTKSKNSVTSVIKSIASNKQHGDKGNKQDYQKHFENFVVRSETVQLNETQPFTPFLISPSQSFSPNTRDTFLLNNSDEFGNSPELKENKPCDNKKTESFCSNGDQLGIVETLKEGRSVKTFINETIEKYLSDKTGNNQEIDKVQLSSVKPNQSKLFNVSHALTSSPDNMKSNQSNLSIVSNALTSTPDNMKLKSKRKSSDLGQFEVEEEMRLNKLSGISVDMGSPEQLLRLLDNPFSSLEDNSQIEKSVSKNEVESSKSQNSVTDQTLCEFPLEQINNSPSKKLSSKNERIEGVSAKLPKLCPSDKTLLEILTGQRIDRKKGQTNVFVSENPVNVDSQDIYFNEESKTLQQSVKRSRCDATAQDERPRKYKRSSNGIRREDVHESVNNDMSVVDNCNKLHNQSGICDGDLPHSESLLQGHKSVVTGNVRSTSKASNKKDEVIIISSGDSECHSSTTLQAEPDTLDVSHSANKSSDQTDSAIEERSCGILSDPNEVSQTADKVSSRQLSDAQTSRKWFKTKDPKKMESRPETLKKNASSGTSIIESKNTKVYFYKEPIEISRKPNENNTHLPNAASLKTTDSNISERNQQESSANVNRPMKLMDTSAQHSNLSENETEGKEIVKEKSINGCNSLSVSKSKGSKTGDSERNKYNLRETRKQLQIQDEIFVVNSKMKTVDSPSVILNSEESQMEGENVDKSDLDSHSVDFECSDRCPKSTVNQKNIPLPKKLTKMDEFLADIRPQTEVGKRLIIMEIPSDVVQSAFNYYRNK